MVNMRQRLRRRGGDTPWVSEQFLTAALSVLLGLATGWIAHDLSNLDHQGVEQVPDLMWPDTPWSIDGQRVGVCTVTREGSEATVDCVPDEEHVVVSDGR